MQAPGLSFWQEVKPPAFEKLTGDITAEIVIVGGGLCGLLCAYELLSKGFTDIVILEAGEVCGGTTARTTAKITSQHRLIYHKIVSGMGLSFAGQYLDANEFAINRYSRIIEAENIDCDFTNCNAYVYSLNPQDTQKLEDELKALQQLKIEADYMTSCELPFEIEAAIRFKNQARFHPLKFGYALADILSKRGVKIFCDTCAVTMEGKTIFTDVARVYGQNIIICTHYPFVNFKGFYFAKIYQSRSYVLALEGAPTPEGMYIDCNENGYSFRSHIDQNTNLLLFGGGGHKTGHEGDVAHYAQLEKAAQRLYPFSTLKYRWSAQDCMTHDTIPYIGRYPKAEDGVYFATGFNKWGMSSSMVAANIISSMIAGENNLYAAVFSPKRSDIMLKAASFVKETADTAGNFITGYSRLPQKTSEELKNGEGGIVNHGGRTAGGYRDDNGELHVIKPICTHMSCPLNWNADERTWDCPCHGSRFTPDGERINIPAPAPLERL